MKTCNRCHQDKPLDQFWNLKRTKDGKARECKTCQSDRVTEYRKTHQQEQKAYYQKVHANRGLPNKIVLFRREHPNRDPLLTVENVIAKFGDQPKCYLTGTPIDLSQRDTYALDHIIPLARGGDSSLANCGLTTRQANQAKHDMTKEEFVILCQSVLNANFSDFGNRNESAEFK